MTMNAKRRKAHDKLAALPGVRSVRRPVRSTGAEEFDLYYVRTGPASDHPLVIIPGGPGAASIGHYRNLRRRTTAAGLDVIMVEHRGVGMSRHDDAGADLPTEALTIEAAVDDIAAVVDDAGVESAVLYGTSYGSYLAAGVGVRHPDKVHAMVLDSPLLCADDIDAVRDATRAALWEGTAPATEGLASRVRGLAADGKLTPWVVQLATGLYGLVGPEVLEQQLELLLTGRGLLWHAIGHSTKLLFESKTPYRHEPDLVEHIGYQELNYAPEPDGLPIDPALAYRESATGDPDFIAEPFDLVTAMPGFDWPTVVISGGRDLITPPAVARRIAELIPGAVLLELPSAGHSVLDMREGAALTIATGVCAGEYAKLPDRATELDNAPPDFPVRLMVKGIATAAAAESMVPAGLPRAIRQLRTW
ncbi:alpha/beta fold hydrolase [Mycolicibacterium mucogenicum]|uniref:alpha/beta fold hydrolase n=1 Tax=Mycolicibacterium mucogenicum TaxID=56689 RepID=UPI00226AA68F|nr:alpha/beta fold hydrolase [Mycolicibacterium mucogenicum]MCX8559359.1 alpha/beta fold hydrolase [Mycolicibacterium mucogenicum]